MAKRASLEKATKRLIDNVKWAGQSVIDNAESIVGDYDYQTELGIHISICMDGVPSISVTTAFIPEKYMEESKAVSYVRDYSLN